MLIVNCMKGIKDDDADAHDQANKELRIQTEVMLELVERDFSCLKAIVTQQKCQLTVRDWALRPF